MRNATTDAISEERKHGTFAYLVVHVAIVSLL